MFITKVTARNLKGGDLDVVLDRANVIHGDNWTQKTTILDAVRLALIGYLPELGNLNKATFGLCSGPFLEVGLEFNNGNVITRTWKAKGDSISATKNLVGDFGATDVLAVMLNAEMYFALGATDRERYVFENIGLQDPPTRKMIGDRIATAGFGDYNLAGAYARIDDWDVKTRKAPPPETPQEELAALIDEVRVDWRRFDGHEKLMQSTVNGLIHLRADDATAPDKSALEERKGVLTREIAEIGEQRGRLLGAFTQMTADRQRRANIDREIQHSMKNRLELVEAKEIQALAQAKLDATPVIPLAVFEDAYRQVLDAKNAVTQAINDKLAAQSVQVVIRGDIAKLSGATICPFCGAAGEGWKELKGTEYVQDLNTAINAEAEAMRAQSAAADRLIAAQKEHAALVIERDQRAAVETKLSTVTARVAKLEPELARVAALHEEVARLMPDDPDLTAGVETLQSKLNVMNQELRGVDALLQKAAGRASELVRLAQAEKDRDAALKSKDLCAAAGKELDALRAELVEAAFKPLLETANAIFGGVLPSPLAFRAGEIGTYRAGGWVGHRTFSGAEKALTYAAIQAALASKSPVKVMLLDELGRFTSENAHKLAYAVLLSIEAGALGQFLGVDPERPIPYRQRIILKDGSDLTFLHHTPAQ